MNHKPISIEETGLEHHLNQTAESHNNFGFDEFDKMMRAEVNTSNIARAFQVSRKTAVKWIEIYQKEKEAKNATAGI